MRAFVAGLACLLVAVSGCAGTSATSKTEKPSESPVVATPSFDDETGSIAGNVTDEEHQPIQGASVGILRTDTVVKTDATGAFAINKLPPGTVSVIVDALGYKPDARKVMVAPGQVVHANFQLVQVSTGQNETYLESWNRVGFINADQTWFTYAYHDIGGQNHSTVCGSCIFTLRFPPGGKEFMTEVGWQQTGVPGYNDAVHVGLRAGGVWGNAIFCWHQKRNWTDSGSPATLVPNMAKGMPAEFTIESGFVGVSVQQKVEMWVTVGYGETVPAEFSAFAPTDEKPAATSTCIVN